MLLNCRELRIVAGLVCFIQASAPCKASTSSAGAEWLAVEEFATGDTLSRSINTVAVQSANLRLAADFCRARIAINGKLIADIEPYCQTQTFDVTDAVQFGENRIELLPEPIPGAPAVIAATLTIIQANGGSQSVSTDEIWIVTTTNGQTRAAESRGQVPVELWGLGRRSIEIDQFENYEQWQQAKGGGGASPSFFVAPGFEITQIRVAQPDEGSWVSLASDARGRLTIAREDQGFLRMTIADDARSISHLQTIDSDLLECRGLVYRDGWLYASANNSKTLFRLQLSEDGQVTNVTTLRELSGGVGHGRNDLSIDGDSLLLICGDSVDPQTANFLDHTSPLRRRVAGAFTREGSLLRTTLDGQQWELLCAGLRNPYGVAKHPKNADPFTYDADNEYDLGMPWYRPTRVLQLLTGADYGYREASGQIPPRFSDQADAAPPLVDIGRGSPTAVIFGKEFDFPQPYGDALFALDWTYGRVIAVHLAPRGASYRAATELFLQGKPLNVTDVAAGRDGAMYLITGGRKTQSALYRVSAVVSPSANVSDATSAETEFDKEVREYARRHREIAQRFQMDEQNTSALEFETVMQSLDAADPVVRYASRISLEKRPASNWSQAVLDFPAQKKSLRGLMAVARVLDSSQVSTIIDCLASISLTDSSIDNRIVWLRTLELCITANPDAVFAKRTALESGILAGWQACQSPQWQVSVEGTSATYRRRAALLLAPLESSQLPELVARDLLSSSVQEDQIAGLMALRNQRLGWTPEVRELQLQTLAAMPQMVGGEGLPSFHAWLVRETSGTLSPDEQARYAALKAAYLQPEPLRPTRPIVRKWTLDELRAIAEDSAKRNTQPGETVFRDALCARCHRFGQRGPSMGPDLTFVAGRFSRHDILDSILNPSKAVAENYRSVTVQTIDGKVVTGRLVPGGDFRTEKVRLIPDLLRPDQIIELDKKSIEAHQPSDLSPMPQGLLDTFTREEIADLLAYLTSRKSTVRSFNSRMPAP